MSLGRIFDQEQTPAFTLISFVTTLIVSATLIVVNTAHYHGWGAALVKFPLTYGPLVLGVVTNFAAGVMAYDRGEHWGGRIAVVGIAICVLTWFVLHLCRVAP